MNLADHPVTRHDLSALWLVFLGGCIIVLKAGMIRTYADGTGYVIDVFDNTVGMLFVTWGVLKLRRLFLDRMGKRWMSFVLLACVFGLISSIGEHWIPSPFALAPPFFHTLRRDLGHGEGRLLCLHGSSGCPDRGA